MLTEKDVDMSGVEPGYFRTAMKTWVEGKKKDSLTEEELNALRQRYNSRYMTNRDTVDLLGDLVEAGILTASRARDIYNGAVPLDVTKDTAGRLEKCTPQTEAVHNRWMSLCGGPGNMASMVRVMGLDYYRAWYESAKLSTNVDISRSGYFADCEKYLGILEQLQSRPAV